MAPASPWHEGERALQRREGVEERLAALGSRVIRDHMPEQHRAFFAQLPFLVVGGVDDDGAPWATVIEGAPGFVSSPDPFTLRVAASLAPGDPARSSVREGAAVGLLGIELPTRRRNRLNGRVERHDERGFGVRVEQSFGNCPQYIHTREQGFVRDLIPGPVEHGDSLDDRARALIAGADTFFVASHAEPGDDVARRQVDVSHRGGKPGFVRLDGDVLTVPDFSGNLFFNTLGNFVLRPRAGLVFLDRERGDLLQLTGQIELVLEGPEIASFDGAERLWRLRVTRWVRRRGALALRLRGGQPSPQSLQTGAWPRPR